MTKSSLLTMFELKIKSSKNAYVTWDMLRRLEKVKTSHFLWAHYWPKKLKKKKRNFIYLYHFAIKFCRSFWQKLFCVKILKLRKMYKIFLIFVNYCRYECFKKRWKTRVTQSFQLLQTPLSSRIYFLLQKVCSAFRIFFRILVILVRNFHFWGRKKPW